MGGVLEEQLKLTSSPTLTFAWGGSISVE